MFCAFTIKAQQNLVLNGSFENNSAINNCAGFYNSNVVNVNNYSLAQVSLIRDSCLTCNPPTYWGGGAQEGHFFIELVDFTSGGLFLNAKISFDLLAPLSNEQSYKLSFYIRKPPPVPPLTTMCSDPKSNYINVGISNNNNSFGTHLITSPLGDSVWTQYSVVFNTQNAEEYVTVEVGTGDTTNWIIHVDNFELSTVTGIDEVGYNNRQLLKIVDVLGRESKPNSNTPLFYIYSDGTVEKRIVVE